MTCRLIVRSLLLIVGVTAILCASAARASAQTCSPETEGCVCVPMGVEGPLVCALSGQPISCPPQGEGGDSTCFAPFTPVFNDWTYVFPDNAIRIQTDVITEFVLQVDLKTTTPDQYAARRAPQFAGTVCNQSAPGTVNCEIFRVHGEGVPRANYKPPVNYTIFWDNQPVDNPNNWMLLRAPCSEFPGDSNMCDGTQLFSQNITTFVDPTAPFPGVDPDAGGSADGFSEYIIARCREGDGDGDFNDKDGHRHHGHFHHNSCENSGGDVEEDDNDTGDHFQSTSVNSATFSSNPDGLALTMVGTGLHDGLPVTFTMISVDHGNLAPGVFMLVLGDGYSVAGGLVNGSIVLR